MNLEKALDIIKTVIYNEDGDPVSYIDISFSQYEGDVGAEEFIKAIETIVNETERLKQDNINKDKTMFEMARWIFDKDYTENSLSICRDDYYSNCIKEVIKYFEKKARDRR